MVSYLEKVCRMTARLGWLSADDCEHKRPHIVFTFVMVAHVLRKIGTVRLSLRHDHDQPYRDPTSLKVRNER